MDHHYDIAIIGLGCAGSHVAIELIKQRPDIKIVVIDNAAAILHKKWSFWEKGVGKWDHIILKEWSRGLFKTDLDSINLDMNPYVYKSINSVDFIAFAKAKLKESNHSTFINSTVIDIDETDSELHAINHSDGTVHAKLVLDSRIDHQFFKDQKAITIQQHFKGWTIETTKDTFNPECFTMMDYSLKDQGTTSFTYILPYSSRKALIEFTYFSPDLVEDTVYDTFLKRYITEQLNITDYKIVEVEKGIIPMTTYDFNQHHSHNRYKIGTAGGWVKPSTGYSFKMTEKKAAILVRNYVNGLPLLTDLFTKRFSIYDSSMLSVLRDFNKDGPMFFHRLYKNNAIHNLFKFLDEETTLSEEISIMKSMTSLRMIKAFFKSLF
ncbi:putative lycopene cyclase [Flavobacteria bacterium BBFL7]|nr:putative lycopene cyclase [Flavobacteria bacterium BBFL7]